MKSFPDLVDLPDDVFYRELTGRNESQPLEILAHPMLPTILLVRHRRAVRRRRVIRAIHIIGAVLVAALVLLY